MMSMSTSMTHVQCVLHFRRSVWAEGFGGSSGTPFVEIFFLQPPCTTDFILSTALTQVGLIQVVFCLFFAFLNTTQFIT